MAGMHPKTDPGLRRFETMAPVQLCWAYVDVWCLSPLAPSIDAASWAFRCIFSEERSKSKKMPERNVPPFYYLII